MPTRASAAFQQCGQAMTDWLIVIASVALVALMGFAIVNTGIGVQSAAVAESLAGGAPSAKASFRSALASSGTDLVDFAQTSAGQAEAESANQTSSYEFAEGLAAGFIDNLLDEISLLLSPIETAKALAALVSLLANDLVSTVDALVEELVLNPADQLINGTAYEKGYVVGNQISATKALSALSKVAGVAVAVKATDAIGDAPVPGTATIRRHGRTHFSVEVRQGDEVVGTHQVTTSLDGSTTEIHRVDQSPPGDSIAEGTIALPDAAAARRRQDELIARGDLGVYDREYNSCVSHACDILGAGGVDVPAKGGSGQSRFIIGITKGNGP